MNRSSKVLCCLLAVQMAACGGPARSELAHAPDPETKTRLAALAWVRDEYSHSYTGYNDIRRDLLGGAVSEATFNKVVADEPVNLQAWQALIDRGFGTPEEAEDAITFLYSLGADRSKWRLHYDSGENDGSQAEVLYYIFIIFAAMAGSMGSSSSHASSGNFSTKHPSNFHPPHPAPAAHVSGGAAVHAAHPGAGSMPHMGAMPHGGLSSGAKLHTGGAVTATGPHHFTPAPARASGSHALHPKGGHGGHHHRHHGAHGGVSVGVDVDVSGAIGPDDATDDDSDASDDSSDDAGVDDSSPAEQ